MVHYFAPPCSLHVPKIIEFYQRIQLLLAKIKVAPFNLAHPVCVFMWNYGIIRSQVRVVLVW